jgi:hypothetical protein
VADLSPEGPSEPPGSEHTDHESFRRFFSNPLVGVIGAVASLCGVALAIYFYSMSTNTRELTYMVHPVKAVVVRGGQTSRLSITLDGRPVQGDVTTAQVACWNAGRSSIRKDQILRPVVLRTSPPVPIVDATIRKETRPDITRLCLDKSNFQGGEVGVSWNIMEGNDGGVIQLVFIGDTKTEVILDGTIEGQRAVSRSKGRPPDGDLVLTVGRRRFLTYFFFTMIIISALSAISNIMRFVRRRKQRIGRFVADIAADVFLAGIIILFYVRSRASGPPFGF